MQNKRKIYTILLEKKERAALNRVKEKMGVRSASDAIRILIKKEEAVSN